MQSLYSHIIALLIGLVIGVLLTKGGTVNNYFKNRRGIQNIDNDSIGKTKRIRWPKFLRRKKNIDN